MKALILIYNVFFIICHQIKVDIVDIFRPFTDVLNDQA